MAKFSIEIERFIDAYVLELASGNAGIFAGAGMSAPAGFVDWKTLLKPLAEELHLDIAKEHDLLGVAQYHVNSKENQRNTLNQLLITNFAVAAAPTESHKLIAKLPVSVIWTTNYDRLIEKAFDEEGRVLDVKYERTHFTTTKPNRTAVLYKMHGDIEHPDKAVLTKDDYEKYYDSHGEFLNALSGGLTERTFLFVGFSFTDPNLDFVLGRIRSRFAQNQKRHFCLMKERSKVPNETEEEFAYDRAKQALMIKDLMRFNIETVLVTDYSQIPEILGEIHKRLRAKTIFIGGSAAEYGTWSQSQCYEMLRDLASALVQQGYRIITGFGLGVGEAVVTGAVERIQKDNLDMDRHLVMRPFPRTQPSEGVTLAQLYTKYRQEIIEPAGIFVAVFGNKQVEGQTVAATGLNEEIDIALSLGLQVVPVGGTGWVSRNRWMEAEKDLPRFVHSDTAELREALARVGQDYEAPNELIQPVLDIINMLSKGN